MMMDSIAGVRKPKDKMADALDPPPSLAPDLSEAAVAFMADIHESQIPTVSMLKKKKKGKGKGKGKKRKGQAKKAKELKGGASFKGSKGKKLRKLKASTAAEAAENGSWREEFEEPEAPADKSKKHGTGKGKGNKRAGDADVQAIPTPAKAMRKPAAATSPEEAAPEVQAGVDLPDDLPK
eukprot:5221985-Pyramimonas_sp.AAC.1